MNLLSFVTDPLFKLVIGIVIVLGGISGFAQSRILDLHGKRIIDRGRPYGCPAGAGKRRIRSQRHRPAHGAVV